MKRESSESMGIRSGRPRQSDSSRCGTRGGVYHGTRAPRRAARPAVAPCSRLTVRLLSAALGLASLDAGSLPFELPAPEGSDRFGEWVALLPNGNIVVADPFLEFDGAIAVGAVHLFRPDGERISTLRGSNTGDRVGSGGIEVLASGHFLVLSPLWSNGSAEQAGAITWVHGTDGLDGPVDVQNSLVGRQNGDRVGAGVRTLLPSGHVVVGSPSWNNGDTPLAGAATWIHAGTGRAGEVSAQNSLVGNTVEARVGHEVTPLFNGHYVVQDAAALGDPTFTSRGSVTWGNGFSGTSGEVSAANSLVGDSDDDNLGSGGVIALPNGHYVVCSPRWGSSPALELGAATWASGSGVTAGFVGAQNSLIGSRAGDQVCGNGVTSLANGNYVVASPRWSRDGVLRVGAVTWGDGEIGVVGEISPANSLVGGVENDQVGDTEVLALRNGHYVAGSSRWRHGAASEAGAATWGDGTQGVRGEISSTNSLVGGAAGNRVGASLVELDDRHYAVVSSQWDRIDPVPVQDVGAVTFGASDVGVRGVVTPQNSVIGRSAGDSIGSGGVAAFSPPRGDPILAVASPRWDHLPAGGGAPISDAGAVTFALEGVGEATELNSLFGTRSADQVGSSPGSAVHSIGGGRFVMTSRFWSSATASEAGAVTFVDVGFLTPGGPDQPSAAVTSANSLTGTTAEDRLSLRRVLADGDFLVGSAEWDAPGVPDAGVLLRCNAFTGCDDTLDASNALIGQQAGDRVGLGLQVASDGHLILTSPDWHDANGDAVGAFTLLEPGLEVRGALSSGNSVFGAFADSSALARSVFDAEHDRLVVGWAVDSRVAVFDRGLFASGFE